MSTLTAIWMTVGMLLSATLAAAPVPKDEKREAKEKEIKEFTGKVVVAIAKQDIDALVDMSEVPWCRSPSNFSKDKKQLHKDLGNMLEGKPVFEAKQYSIKSIETFKAAQATLGEREIEGYKTILTEEDLIIHVEVDYPKQKVQIRLLVKWKDEKPRLVGSCEETRKLRPADPL